ncbi:MAG: chromosome partitioning protein ParA, partial [Muribaculum sp.]|nr:chromosome partitioning protein ParA [Muribaculum sp.]
PTYTRTASLLIKDEESNSSISSQLSSLSELGVFSSGANVTNEMVALQSPSVILEVVRRLNLDMSYITSKNFRKKYLYGLTLPVTASLNGYPESESCSFVMLLNRADSTVTLHKFRNKEGKIDAEVSGALGDTIDTPLGPIAITPTPYYNSPDNVEIEKITVVHTPPQTAIDIFQGKLTVELADKDATVLNLTCNDVNIQRAEDFINTLISAYNEDWVRDKNQIATATSQFINDRLAVIEQELGHVDSDISSYKSEHLIPDLALVSQMYLDQSHEAANHVLELNNQLYMARYIRTFLADERNKGQLLPANSGLGNSTVEKQIADYNTLMLERNSLASNSSESNPLVIDRDNSLEASRSAIITSIDNQISALNAQIRAFRGSESKSRNQIASNPQQAKYLLSVERQQKVKEALYLFLLQKREENELSQAFTAYNTRIITPPMGPAGPTSP